ncbi:hypothetical protein CL614_06975 [archaeon]|nr:hypothetical protein [archaeon]
MNLNREQAEIIMTALNNYRGELYVNSNNTDALNKVSDLIRDIEDSMKSKDISQKRIPVTKEMYTATEVGSETGIELEDNYNMKPGGCINCDE